MNVKIVITYKWWDEDSDEINPEHLEQLDQDARDRIAEFMKEGDVGCGELCDEFENLDGSSVAYRGWWDLSKFECSDKD